MDSAPSNENFLRYEKALPYRMREMIAKTPVAYVPFGALEWHGEHAALGLDGIKAEEICARAAARTGGVLFPTVYWGAFHTLKFPFTFHFSKRALRRQVRITLASLASWGFRTVVLLTGHYPLAQINIMKNECRRAVEKFGIAALGIPEQALALDLGYLGDHAAKWETSLLMAIDPSLVELHRLPDDTGTPVDRARTHGIFGPCPKAHANAEIGRRALDTIVERLGTAVKRMSESGTTDAAEEIYRNYEAAFKKPFEAGRVALGTDSKWEMIRFFLWNVFHNRHL